MFVALPFHLSFSDRNDDESISLNTSPRCGEGYQTITADLRGKIRDLPSLTVGLLTLF